MKSEIAQLLSKNISLNKEDIEKLIEIPPSPELGDYAFPCFTLAKELKKSPIHIAEDLSKRIKSSEFEKIEAKGPYVNFFVNKSNFVKTALKESGKKDFGKSKLKGKILIDYSHPNVAKHFGIHNLRSTLIGHAIYNTLEFSGYKVRSINHLGDWGTQFGKLLVAYKKFRGKLNINNIESLNELYIKFHTEAEKNPELEENARNEFKKLELGDKENLKLWKLFREISLKEFDKTYKILGIKFDEIKGESYFKDSVKTLVADLKQRHIAEESEGALVIKQPGERPPLILQKSDEASTYASRDLAAIVERMKSKPDKILYVVDNAQSLHFEQVFEAAERLGINRNKLEHVKFGRLRFEDSQMSTRTGNIILFESLLEKAEEEIKKIINEKNPSLKNKDKIAKQVALASIIYHDLQNNRLHDIIFDWKTALSFEGKSGPYILYTYARASSILSKVKKKTGKLSFPKSIAEKEFLLAKKINSFPEVVEKSARDYSPHTIAEYSYELAQCFNEFYHSCQVIGSEEESFRLSLIKSFQITLNTSLNLIGITPVDEM
ncbi:MAG: arginine--tRNA ligase [Nanoarchaeota archaeon]